MVDYFKFSVIILKTFQAVFGVKKVIYGMRMKNM